jgi:FkbM family methyltransferase
MKLRSAGVLTDIIWNHPANRGRRVRALAKSAAWQLYKRTIRKPIDVPALGYRFRCYADSHDASRMIYFNGCPDPSEMEFIRRYLRPGDRVIDAGANVGVYSLLFASLIGRGGFVLAFEPDPQSADRLRENLAINSITNIRVRQAALSIKPGMEPFTQGADTGNTLYSLKTYDRPPQMVEVTTFDREIHSDSYALCKMDIEGAELDALKGAATSLRRLSPPVWVMELSEKTSPAPVIRSLMSKRSLPPMAITSGDTIRANWCRSSRWIGSRVGLATESQLPKTRVRWLGRVSEAIEPIAGQ